MNEPQKLTEFLIHNYGPVRNLSAGTIAIYNQSIRLLAEHIGREPTLDDLIEENIFAVANGGAKPHYTDALRAMSRFDGRAYFTQGETQYDSELSRFHAEKGHTRRTREHYRAVFRRFGDLELTDENLAVYREQRLAHGLAKDSVRGELGRLMAYARWKGLNPKTQQPKKVRREPQAWSRNELRRLFKEARTTERTIYGIPGAIYWPAILGLAYDTGERITAIAALEWSDIDFDQRSVRYRAETRKGSCADHQGTFSRGTRRDLLRLRGFGKGRPFRLGCESTRWKAYTTLLKDAGLPSDRRSKFHRLRRTHATWLHWSGGDATASLGHSSSDITRDAYLDKRYTRKGRLPSISVGIVATVLAWFGWR